MATNVYTNSELEAIRLFSIVTGSTSTNHDPEKAIRFFTRLVDNIREERQVVMTRLVLASHDN
jgi:hypothetical protein